MTKKTIKKLEPSSFRDPSGFVFYQNDQVFRQINTRYQQHYNHLMSSGLYQALVTKGCLLPYQEVSNVEPVTDEAYKIVTTQSVPLISYPYEWTFSQLKDAALLTLEIQKNALTHGMTLKDASAYNIQFVEGRPVLIDFLSFEIYEVGKPWIAYRQFCQHFLGPLALMSLTDVRLNQLLRVYIDGIPLDMVSKLLPKKSYAQLSLLTHIHFHARNQRTYADSTSAKRSKQINISQVMLEAIVDSLEKTVRGLSFGEKKTEWGEYYTFTNYSDRAFQQKKELIEIYLNQVKPKTVWDLGANMGEFSRIASDQGIFTLSSDLDPIAVEKNYLIMKERHEKHILPLVIDLTNPSSALGWANQERKSLTNRGPADVVMALALIHHLCISNNLTLLKVADFLASIGEYVIIEFVPKQDSQVQKLLMSRQDIFPNYTEAGFEKAFSQYFRIIKKEMIEGSKRTLYLLKVNKRP